MLVGKIGGTGEAFKMCLSLSSKGGRQCEMSLGKQMITDWINLRSFNNITGQTCRCGELEVREFKMGCIQNFYIG